MTAKTETLLRLKGLSKTYPGVLANDDVSLAIRAGEIHALLGENGAGKSTLVRMIYGLARPDGGTMELRGADYRPARPAEARRLGVAMVFQHFSLFEALNVAENDDHRPVVVSGRQLLLLPAASGGEQRREIQRLRLALEHRAVGVQLHDVALPTLESLRLLPGRRPHRVSDDLERLRVEPELLEDVIPAGQLALGLNAGELAADRLAVVAVLNVRVLALPLSCWRFRQRISETHAAFLS